MLIALILAFETFFCATILYIGYLLKMQMNMNMMKRITLIAISMLVLGANVRSQSPSKPNTKSISNKGTLLFDETSVNFGKVDEDDGELMKAFEYRNISNFPVKILSVESGCGCTIAEYDKNPILSQKEGAITIKFDPKNRPGDFDRTITIRTDGQPEYIYLHLYGSVTNSRMEYISSFPIVQGNMRLTTNKVNFSLTDKKRDSAVVTLLNNSKKMISITSVKTPPYIRAEILKPMLMPDDACQIKITYFGDIANDYGTKNDELYIQTSDDSVPKKTVLVRADIVQDFSNMTASEKKNAPVVLAATTEHNFGEVYLGEVVSYDFIITNKGKSDLRIMKVNPDCGCIVGSYTKDIVKKGKTGTITIKFNSKGYRGAVSKNIQVFVNDPKNPVLFLKIKANVVIPGVDPISK